MVRFRTIDGVFRTIDAVFRSIDAVFRTIDAVFRSIDAVPMGDAAACQQSLPGPTAGIPHPILRHRGGERFIEIDAH
jgi:hypothetical protein